MIAGENREGNHGYCDGILEGIRDQPMGKSLARRRSAQWPRRTPDRIGDLRSASAGSRTADRECDAHQFATAALRRMPSGNPSKIVVPNSSSKSWILRVSRTA